MHKDNRYARQAAEELGLELMSPEGLESRGIGILNGSTLQFRSSPWKFITIAKMLWRYGYSSLHTLDSAVQAMLGKFMKSMSVPSDQHLILCLPV